MPQILCVACFIALFQLDGSNALLVILISDYDLLLEKTGLTTSIPNNKVVDNPAIILCFKFLRAIFPSPLNLIPLF